MFKALYITSILLLFSSCGNDKPFDKNKWKNAPVKGPEMSIRWDMSVDLMNNYNLMGKDTTEIFELLGNEGLDCYNNKCVARYTLGPCHRGIDYGTRQ